MIRPSGSYHYVTTHSLPHPVHNTSGLRHLQTLHNLCGIPGSLSLSFSLASFLTVVVSLRGPSWPYSAPRLAPKKLRLPERRTTRLCGELKTFSRARNYEKGKQTPGHARSKRRVSWRQFCTRWSMPVYICTDCKMRSSKETLLQECIEESTWHTQGARTEGTPIAGVHSNSSLSVRKLHRRVFRALPLRKIEFQNSNVQYMCTTTQKRPPILPSRRLRRYEGQTTETGKK